MYLKGNRLYLNGSSWLIRPLPTIPVQSLSAYHILIIADLGNNTADCPYIITLITIGFDN